MTKRNFSDLVAVWANIFKSIPSEHLDDLKHVEDLWNEPGGQFALPTRAEIKTGRPQESSGGGAERMVREFSDVEPQMGMTQKYAEFSSMLRDFGKSLDGVHATQKTQATQIETLATILTTAAKAQTAPVTKGDAEESVLTKAESKLRKARAELRKADMADDEDAEEREEKKSNLDAARVALKAAKRLLAKAQDQDEWPDADEEKCEKARHDFAKLTKALKKAEEDERDREDAEKARDAAAATAKAEAEKAAAVKAAADAVAAQKAEQVEDKDEEEKTEKAKTAEPVAAKAAETAPIDPGLRDQIQVMNTTLKGLMETVMSGSKGAPVPTFAKATPVVALAEKIEAAIEDGTLESPLEIMKAHTLISHVRAVQDGKMDVAVVDDEIAKAPDNVRQLFMPAQAA